jgi:hypothetical protein
VTLPFIQDGHQTFWLVPGFDTRDTIFKGTTQGLFGSNFAFIPSRVSEEKDIKDFHFSTNQVWSNLSQ